MNKYMYVYILFLLVILKGVVYLKHSCPSQLRCVKIEMYLLEIAKYTNGKNVLVVWWWCRGVGCTKFDRDCNLHFKHIIFCETEIFKCAKIKKNHMTCLKIPNGVIKSRKSKYRQTRKIKMPNNDLQNIIQKTKMMQHEPH